MTSAERGQFRRRKSGTEPAPPRVTTAARPGAQFHFVPITGPITGRAEFEPSRDVPGSAVIRRLKIVDMETPATVAGAVRDAPALVQSVGQALVYFTTHPTRTLAEFHTSVATEASRDASLAPTRRGVAHAASGAPYTIWRHKAVLTESILQMLITKRYAHFRYESAFKTETEAFSGGDTEEYMVDTFDPDGGWERDGAWETRWVLHIHRKKGESKAAVPMAAHLKRYEQRKLKDATRILVRAELAAKARLTNPTSRSHRRIGTAG